MSDASGAVIAKARAMYGNRLFENNYNDLLRKQSVSEVAGYLKTQTNYAEVLSDVNENLIHRGQLENLLRRDLYEEYTRLIYFDQSINKDFMGFIIVKAEIDQILTSILNVSNGEPVGNFHLPLFFVKQLGFDVYRLFKASSIKDILETLENTPYHEIIKEYAADFSPYLYTKIAADLRRYYFSDIFSRIDKYVAKSSAPELNEFFMTMAELENITSIIRLKSYFNYTPDKIKPYMLPYFCKIKRVDIGALIEELSIDEVFKFLATTKYGNIFEDIKLGDYGKNAQFIRLKTCKRLIRVSQNMPSVMVAYVFLKEIEIKNIISIIEGIRYGTEPAAISEMLVTENQSNH